MPTLLNDTKQLPAADSKPWTFDSPMAGAVYDHIIERSMACHFQERKLKHF